ncbi:MAG: hypothetical protein M0Z51_07320 [Propionibacterium sp.]|nr:hypothetical protein [Propionibacterium sp.]
MAARRALLDGLPAHRWTSTGSGSVARLREGLGATIVSAVVRRGCRIDVATT